MIQLLRRLALGLDPARATNRLAEYDTVRGFDAYADHCRTGHPAPDGTGALARDGVDLLDVMPSAAATALRDRLAGLPLLPPRDVDVDFTDCFDLPPAFEQEIIAAVLTTPVAAAIERHFGSPFMLYNMHVSRLSTGAAAKRSLLWHCDSGPSRHLKLLTYLDDSEATGGNTAFLDRGSSDRFLAVGYTFGPLGSRRTDLMPIARRYGIRYQPLTWQIRPGQGLLFEPSRVLHRGVVPGMAPRHIVTMLLLPSAARWQPGDPMPGRQLGLGFRFPRQASSLLDGP